MARDKQNHQVDTPTSPPAKPTPTLIAVDYRGQVGRAPGQTQVKHIRSPWILFWPNVGQMELILHPGVTMIPSDTFEFYKENHPRMKQRIAEGRVKVLTRLPDDEALESMIERSIDHDGLEWIKTQENTRDEPRSHVIDGCNARLSSAIPVAIKPRPYTTRVNFVGTNKVVPTMAMG